MLVPSALFLAYKAGAGEFDTAFYVVQGMEMIAGAVNTALLGLNMHDGFKMTGVSTAGSRNAQAYNAH